MLRIWDLGTAGRSFCAAPKSEKLCKKWGFALYSATALFFDRNSGIHFLHGSVDLSEFMPNIWSIASSFGTHFTLFSHRRELEKSPGLRKSFFRPRLLQAFLYTCIKSAGLILARPEKVQFDRELHYLVHTLYPCTQNAPLVALVPQPGWPTCGRMG